MVEKKLTHLEQTAQQMVQHYDSCFIDLAKQVRIDLLALFYHTAGRMSSPHGHLQAAGDMCPEALPGHTLSRSKCPSSGSM